LRKLTDHQKAQRTAKMRARKEQKARTAELGPLFAHQAEPVPVMSAQQQRIQTSMTLARRMAGDGHGTEVREALDWIQADALARLAAQHLPQVVVKELLRYCRETYRCPSYHVSFWLGVLSGRRVVYRYKVVGTKQTSYGVFNDVREDGTWPPEGWVRPLTKEQARAFFWKECKDCKRWHAPGQRECYAEPALSDPLRLEGQP
jgi:hypothetical protein